LYSTFISQGLNNYDKTPQVLQTPNLVDMLLAEIYTEYYQCSNYNGFNDNTALNQQIVNQVDPNDSCQSCRSSSLIFDKYPSSSCNQTSSTLSNITIPSVLSDYPFAYPNNNNLNPACSLLYRASKPDKPSFDSTTKFCKNVATQIKYVIFWKDQKIVKILTRVVLNDILLTSYSNLKQSFELIWHPYNDTDTELTQITTMSNFEIYLTNQALQKKLSGSAGNS
jgi:hypothetical protein